MSEGKKWEPKYSQSIEYSDFSTDYGTHHIMHFPTNINEDTGFGKMFGLGAGKLRAIMKDPVAVREFLAKYPEEGTVQCKLEDHVGKEWKRKDNPDDNG
jgi:hypothetical protein